MRHFDVSMLLLYFLTYESIILVAQTIYYEFLVEMSILGYVGLSWIQKKYFRKCLHIRNI